eukprot:5568334-Prorocentrum_lima.AAC.1
MTSSLVGSEMCIRDRPRCGKHCPHSRTRSQCLLRSVHRPGLRRSQAVYPVSYTHLTLPTICSV